LHFIDLHSQYALLKPRIDSRIQQVLDHGIFINGPEVKELESRLQEHLKVKHAIACGNGTDALVLSLMALGIKNGDAVFCPSFTFFATAEAIASCGAMPVFVDSEFDTFNICPNSLEEAVKEVQKDGKYNLKAVIAVDLFGLPANYSSINKIANRYNMKILEDAAQGFGGEFEGVRAGAFGDIAITSFFPSKPLGCYGDGGAVFTNDDEYAETVRSLAHHGKGSNKYDNIRIGMNSRLDTIQATILLEKLQVLPNEITLREEVASHYGKNLESVVETPVIPTGYSSSWAQYTIKSPERDKIRDALAQKEIPTMIYYSKCMHQQSAFTQSEGNFVAAANLVRSEKLSEEVLSLPMHPYLHEKDIETVCEAVKSTLE
jgi:dTDP-4-amino-4,6-dideoxygalactose transaminase